MNVPDPKFLLNQEYKTTYNTITLFDDAKFSLVSQEWEYYEDFSLNPLPESKLLEIIPVEEIIRVRNLEAKQSQETLEYLDSFAKNIRENIS